MHYDHCDVLLRIWHVRNQVDISLQHIKAHQDPWSHQDLLLRYRQLGNAYADCKAKHAALNLIPSFVTSLQEMHADMEQQRSLLLNILDLHWQLYPVRLAAAQQLEAAPQVEQEHKKTDIVAAFSNWTISEGRVFQLQPFSPLLDSSVWGRETMQKVMCWLAAIVWPPDDDHSGPLGKTTGTAWPELLLSFVAHQRTWLPIIRKNALHVKQVIVLGSHDHAADYATTVAEQATTLRWVIDQIAAFHMMPVWPQIQRKKISSLYIQGLGQYTQGIVSRPFLPFQEQTARILHERFSGVSRDLSWLPKMDVDEVPLVILHHSWDRRQAICDSALRKARLQKRSGVPAQ
eukprot:Skav207075  [mRNA]  locus=scaffold1909:306697:307734:+ [translate_table: standard]